MALKWLIPKMPLGVLQRLLSQNEKLSNTFLELTFPAYCSPACYPLRAAWDDILDISWLGISLAVL